MVTQVSRDLPVGASPHVRAWFWSGQSWREIKLDMPNSGMNLDVRGISPSGQVFLTNTYREQRNGQDMTIIDRILWSPSGVKVLPPYVNTAFNYDRYLLAAEGQVAGTDEFPDSPLVDARGTKRHASIAVGNQVIDLNTVVAPPANFVFTKVISANSRGQLLVEMINTDLKTERRRLWVFTPR